MNAAPAEAAISCADSSLEATAYVVAEIFERAKQRFSDGNFQEAIELSQNASRLARCTMRVIDQRREAPARISIIVVTYRHGHDFERLVTTFNEPAYGNDFEVIVVNNGNPQAEHFSLTACQSLLFIDAGFNYGCSGGRNLGAYLARGEYILFVDDDGILEENAIRHLRRAIETTGAVSVRGRVVPKTSSGAISSSYDKGALLIPSIADAEGISIWRRYEFLEFGGFDPLLYGHEGLLLLSKMFRFFGPECFLYCPDATLKHDYISDPFRKKQREQYLKLADLYLDFLGIDKKRIVKCFDSFRQNSREAALYVYTPRVNATRVGKHRERISVITTARDGVDFATDYTKGLKHQTHTAFELIFVDDRSQDGTAERIAELWKNDSRLNLVEAGSGRSAALNIGLETASEDICLIADIDDVSVPRRIEWTLDYFEDNPDFGCVGFSYFNDQGVYGWGRPLSPDLGRISARALLGMPVPFPSFAFRKSAFRLAFDPELKCGIDCDWIYRNLRLGAADGHYIPRNAVYYRVHDQQISASKRAEQEKVALNCISRLHSDFLGELTEADNQCIRILSGWERPNARADLYRTYEYMKKLGEMIAYSSTTNKEIKLAILHYRALELQQNGIRIPMPVAASISPNIKFKYGSKTYWHRRKQKLHNSFVKRLNKIIS